MKSGSPGILTRLVFSALIGVAVVMTPAVAEAALPQLRIAPLKYEQQLELGSLKTGVIDVSNPTGSPMNVVFEVQGFRQVNNTGELEYFDDERLRSAITPALREFVLGPREAVRVKFAVDPNKLGPGGAYGVIFLRTNERAADGQVNTSARVGTLLILNIGGVGSKNGRIQKTTLPRWVYGRSELPLTVTYANTGNSTGSLAFAPDMEAKVGWWGQPMKVKGAFVFPGRTRQSTMEVATGNQLGLVPVTISDKTGGAVAVTRWVMMVTGFWAWLLPLLVVVMFGLGLGLVRFWRRRPAEGVT